MDRNKYLNSDKMCQMAGCSRLRGNILQYVYSTHKHLICPIAFYSDKSNSLFVLKVYLIIIWLKMNI